MPGQPQRWRNTSGEGGRRQARRSTAAKLDRDLHGCTRPRRGGSARVGPRWVTSMRSASSGTDSRMAMACGGTSSRATASWSPRSRRWLSPLPRSPSASKDSCSCRTSGGASPEAASSFQAQDPEADRLALTERRPATGERGDEEARGTHRGASRRRPPPAPVPWCHPVRILPFVGRDHAGVQRPTRAHPGPAL